MGQFVGADPDALERLGNEFHAEAERIRFEVIRKIEFTVASAGWKGRDAVEFRDRWNSDLRPKLIAVVGALHQAGEILIKNANDQRRTSSTGGDIDAMIAAALGMLNRIGDSIGEVADSPKPSLWDRGMDVLRNAGETAEDWGDSLGSKIMTGGLFGLTAATFLSSNKSVIGRYSDTWHQVTKGIHRFGVPESLMHFKSSPTFQAIHNLTESHHKQLAALSKGGDVLGTAGFVVGMAGKAHSIGESLGQKDYLSTGFTVAEGTADILKTNKNPISYLSGAAVQTYTEVGKAWRENVQDGSFSKKGWGYFTNASAKNWGDGMIQTGKDGFGIVARVFL